MDKHITLIPTVLEYYDKNVEKYTDLIKRIRYIKFKRSDNESTHNIITLYDKHNIELINSRYEYAGEYRNLTKTWSWGWALIDIASKKNTNIIRKLWNYGAELNPDENFLLKKELITSSFIISNPIQLDIYIAFA